jgi:beta-mannanase
VISRWIVIVLMTLGLSACADSGSSSTDATSAGARGSAVATGTSGPRIVTPTTSPTTSVSVTTPSSSTTASSGTATSPTTVVSITTPNSTAPSTTTGSAGSTSSGAGAGGATTSNAVASAAINGLCGSSNGITAASAPTGGLCSAGSASSVTGNGPWAWSCSGSNGGKTASCAVSKTPAQASQVSAASAADPNANVATRNVLGYLEGLKNQTNHGLVSGQWVGWGGNFDTAEIQNIQSITGHLPGLIGADYCSGGIDTSANPSIINYWNQGALIVVDVLMPNPWTGSCWDNSLPQGANFNDVVTPGTAAYTVYMNNLALVAQGLQQLQNAGVVVLFRPLAEQDGNWFWYDSQPKFAQLWINTFNYLTNTAGLHNLLWVFATGVGTLNYYPGNQYVDIVGYDTYGYGDQGFGMSAAYSALQSTGKPYALTEFGLQSASYDTENDPPMDLNAAINSIQQTMPNAVYFMAWSNANGSGGPYTSSGVAGKNGNYWGIDAQINAAAALNNPWIQNSPVPY